MDVESIEPRGKAETRKTISPKGVITRLKEEKTIIPKALVITPLGKAERRKIITKGSDNKCRHHIFFCVLKTDFKKYQGRHFSVC